MGPLGKQSGQILPGQRHLRVDVLLGASAGAQAPSHGIEGNELFWLVVGGGAAYNVLTGLSIGVEAHELLVLGIGQFGQDGFFVHLSVGSCSTTGGAVRPLSCGQGAGLGWEWWWDAGSLWKRWDRLEVRAGIGIPPSHKTCGQAVASVLGKVPPSPLPCLYLPG